MPPYVIFAFHTDDDIYTAEAERLRESLTRVLPDIPRTVLTIPKAGRVWKTIVNMKPRYVREQLKDGVPAVLYLDADAAVIRRPVLFDDFPGDLGVHLRPGKDLFASTIFVKNTERGRFLVDRWVELTESNPKNDDQHCLQQVVDKFGPEGIVCLPESYANKFDKLLPDAVIGQYQASRKVRNRYAGRLL